MNASYASFWKDLAERRDWAKEAAIARTMYDKAPDWQVNPSGCTELAWNHYLRIRVWSQGGLPEPAAFCLAAAKRDADEADRRNVFEQASLPGGFPLNRFTFLMAKVFVDAFAEKAPLTRATVLRIAADQAVLAPIYDQRQWDAAPQSQYLHSIDLLLLIGAYDEARTLFKESRGLRGRHVKDLQGITKRIANDPEATRQDGESAAAYRRTFDLLRDPNYADGGRGHPSTLTQRLIMACMLQKYFEPGDGDYDLDRAIGMIGE